MILFSSWALLIWTFSPELLPLSFKPLSRCCFRMINRHGIYSSPVNAYVLLLYLFNRCSRYYDHNRCMSWIKKDLQPNGMLDLFHRCYFSISFGQKQTYADIAQKPCSWTTPTRPASGEPSPWTRWPYQIIKHMRGRNMEKKIASKPSVATNQSTFFFYPFRWLSSNYKSVWKMSFTCVFNRLKFNWRNIF